MVVLENHLILTTNGFKYVENLRIDDLIVNNKYKYKKLLNIVKKKIKCNVLYLTLPISNIEIMVSKDTLFYINNNSWLPGSKLNTLDFVLNNNRINNEENIILDNHFITIKLFNNLCNFSDNLYFVFGYCYKAYNYYTSNIYIVENRIVDMINDILLEHGFKQLKKLYKHHYLIEDIELLYQLNFIIADFNVYKLITRMNIDNIKYFLNGYYNASNMIIYTYNINFLDLVSERSIFNYLPSYSHEYSYEYYEYSYKRAMFLQYISFYLHECLHIKQIFINGKMFYQLLKHNNIYKSNDPFTLQIPIIKKKYIKRNTYAYDLNIELNNSIHCNLLNIL